MNLNVELPPAPPEPPPPPAAPTKEHRPAWQRWLVFAVAAVAASVLLTYVVGLMANDTPMTTTVASDGCFNAEAFDAYNEQVVVRSRRLGEPPCRGIPLA